MSAIALRRALDDLQCEPQRRRGLDTACLERCGGDVACLDGFGPLELGEAGQPTPRARIEVAAAAPGGRDRLLAALREGPPRIDWTPPQVWSLAFLVVVLSIGASMLWFWILQHGEASRVSAYFFLSRLAKIAAYLLRANLTLARTQIRAVRDYYGGRMGMTYGPDELGRVRNSR